MPPRRSGPSPAAPGGPAAASAKRSAGTAAAKAPAKRPAAAKAPAKRPAAAKRSADPVAARAAPPAKRSPKAKRAASATATVDDAAPAVRQKRPRRTEPPAPPESELVPEAAVPDPQPDPQPDAAEEVAEPAAPRRRRGPVWPAVLGVLTVLLGGFAIWVGVQAHNLNSAPAAGNAALTDRAATTRIIGQITSTVNSIFSYNYSDPARTMRAARQGLAGPAVRQYRGIFATMQRDGSRYTRLVLTTTVTNAGVEMLEGNHARVLVFGTQILTSGSQAPQSFGAMVALDLVQQGGTWKIDNIDTFTGNS